MEFSSLFRPPLSIFLLLSLLASVAQSLHPYLDIHHKVRSYSYGRHDYEVLDVSPFHLETDADSYPGIKVVNAAEIFKPDTVFLGFGLPNVFTARVIDKDTVKKFDVKSFYREESHVLASRGRVQSGYFIVLKDVPPEAIKAVSRLAKERESAGRTYASCAQGNYELLQAAGFTITSVDPSVSYLLPTSLLLQSILINGIAYKGKRVLFDIVTTKSCSLKEFMSQLDAAIKSTFKRHLNKSLVTDEYKRQAKERSALVAEENARLKSQHPPLAPSNRVYSLETSVPSNLGGWARSIWGEHTIYKIALNGPGAPKVTDYLPMPLKEFLHKKTDCGSRMKRRIFSEGRVSWIRRNMASLFSEPKLIDEGHILDLLHPHTEDRPNIFNFVVTDQHLLIVKLSVHYGWVDWMLAKHLVVSDFSSQVHFAGELYKTPEGVVHITRNSGTYQPTDEQLLQLLAFANVFFPNIPIVVDGIFYHQSDLPKEDDEKRPSAADPLSEEENEYTMVDREAESAQPLIHRLPGGDIE